MAKLKKPLDPNEPVNEGIVGQASNAALGGLSAVGNLLSLPGSMVLDALSFRNPLDQLLSPFSPDNRTTGKDILRNFGVVGKGDSLASTIAGMGVELALDPMTYLSLGINAGLTPSGKAAKAIGLMDMAPHIATARMLPERQLFPGSKLIDKVAEAVTPSPDKVTIASKLEKKLPLTMAEKGFKAGIKPTNRPMGQIGPRQAAREETLNSLLAGLPEVSGEYNRVGGIRVYRDEVLRRLDEYAQKQYKMSAVDFAKQYGDEKLSLGASIGIPFMGSTPIEIPLTDKIGKGLDIAGQYLKWGFPGRALSFLFESAAGNQIQGQAQDIARGIHADMPGQMSIQAEKMLRAKERSLNIIEDFHQAFQGADLVDLLKNSDDTGDWTVFKVDNLHRSREAFDRLLRFAAETQRQFGGDAAKAVEGSIDKLFKFSGKSSRDNAVQAALHSGLDSLITELKGYVNSEFADATSAGIKSNVIGSEHSMIDYFPRSWDIDPTDPMTMFREFMVKTANTKGRETSIALMPAEIVRSLATNPMLRKFPNSDELAKWILNREELGKYLYSPQTATENIFPQAKESAKQLADWILSLPTSITKTKQGIVYGRSPLEDVAMYLENMTKLRVTQQAVHHTLLNNIVKKGDEFAGATMPLWDTLDKAGYNADAAIAHMADVIGGPNALETLMDASVPLETANAVTSIGSKMQGSQRWMGLLGLWWDKITSVYKENLTLPFPSFSGRNSGSGQIMNATSGHIETPQDFASYFEKVQIARDIKKSYWDAQKAVAAAAEDARLQGLEDLGSMSEAGASSARPRASRSAPKIPDKYKDIIDELHIHDVYKYGYNPTDLEHFSQINMDVVPPSLFGNPKDVLAKAKENVAAKPWPIANEKLAKAVDKARVAHETALEFGRRASAEGEWYNRVPMYLYLRDKGFSAAEAAHEVRKLHVDYSDLTQFEKQVMRRIIPFYTFSRKMAEQTARQIMERQGGMPLTSVAGSIKAIESMRNPGELVPDYVAETASIPLGEDSKGNRNFITGFGLAFEDPVSFLGKGLRGAGLELLSRTHPLLKAPLEYSTGELFFQAGPEGGRNLSDADPLLGRLMANVTGKEDAVKLPQLVEVAAANSPLARYLSTARQVTDPRKSIFTKASNLTTGVRISTVSPAASDAVLRENVNTMLRETGGKEFVRAYVPDRIKESMSKEELARSTQLLDTLNTLARRAKARKELAAAEEARQR